MYQNVIVPYDGSPPGRAGLAHAADLAWRCGARIVIVNNSEVSDAASKAAVKSRAIAMSDDNVDFWVDTNLELGDALVEAARFRPDPIVVLALPPRGVLRRKHVLTPTVEEVVRAGVAPILVVGPQTDTSEGLAFVELVAALDGSPVSEAVLPVVTAWADRLSLPVVLVGVATSSDDEHIAEDRYLADLAASLASDGVDAGYEVLTASDPATGLVERMGRGPAGVLFVGRHGRHGGRGVLGDTAAAVLGTSTRATVVVPG